MKAILQQKIPFGTEEMSELVQRMDSSGQTDPSLGYITAVFDAVIAALDSLSLGCHHRVGSTSPLKEVGLVISLDLIGTSTVLTVGVQEDVNAIRTKLMKGISLGKWLSDNANVTPDSN